MRIGIDFDNTIVCYDQIFHKVALEQGLVDQSVAVNKVAVRDHLRGAGQEALWTELQGRVYGSRMEEAAIFSGVLPCMVEALQRGDELVIISHKTRHPVIGPRYDLHQAARAWIEQNLVSEAGALFTAEQLFFKPTREEKLAQIAASGCDLFIDDLPEVLSAPTFPNTTKAILFDPEEHHSLLDLDAFSSWQQIIGHLGMGP